MARRVIIHNHLAKATVDAAHVNDEAAEYKGRKYKLLWIGNTKYGRRARLGFFDGSKEFWVDASAIRTLSPASSSGRSGGLSPMEQIYGKGRYGPIVTCQECGGKKAPGDPCGEPCD
jgi:hypothetical protein